MKRILIIVNQTFTRNRRRNVNIRGKGKHGTEPGTEILDISKVQNTIKYTYNKAKSSESFHKTRKCFLIVIGEIYKVRQSIQYIYQTGGFLYFYCVIQSSLMMDHLKQVYNAAWSLDQIYNLDVIWFTPSGA